MREAERIEGLRLNRYTADVTVQVIPAVASQGGDPWFKGIDKPRVTGQTIRYTSGRYVVQLAAIGGKPTLAPTWAMIHEMRHVLRLSRGLHPNWRGHE